MNQWWDGRRCQVYQQKSILKNTEIVTYVMGSLLQMIHILKACSVRAVSGIPPKPWSLQNCFVTWKSSKLHENISMQRFSKEKFMNIKSRSDYWRAPLHQMFSRKASFWVADSTAKAKRPLNIGEESNLPAAKDICHETLGEVGIRKWYVFLLWLAPSLGELVK